jgi:CHAD domain-containing protein
MQEALEKLTERVERSANGLKHGYRVRELHALRVGIRRIRTFLKQSGSHRARRLRKTWGGFAAATNDARDWDVFHKTARKLLEPDEFTTFRRLNRERLHASRQQVAALVASGHWSRHLEQWRAYLERWSARETPGSERRPSLDAVLDKAGAALALATEANDDRAWHKFRIAVKETRYIAEASRGRSARTREVIATCKSLQATLGEWHDTVIQLQLLEEVEPDPVHERLRSLIRERKRLSLSQTCATLAAQSVFVPR